MPFIIFLDDRFGNRASMLNAGRLRQDIPSVSQI